MQRKHMNWCSSVLKVLAGGPSKHKILPEKPLTKIKIKQPGIMHKKELIVHKYNIYHSSPLCCWKKSLIWVFRNSSLYSWYLLKASSSPMLSSCAFKNCLNVIMAGAWWPPWGACGWGSISGLKRKIWSSGHWLFDPYQLI